MQQEIFGDAGSDSELSDERPVELRDSPVKGASKRVFSPQSDDDDEQPATKKFAAAASASDSRSPNKPSTSLRKGRDSTIVELSSDENGTSKPRPRPRPVMTGDERPSTSRQKPKKEQVLNIEASIEAYLNSWQIQIRRLHKNRKTMPPKVS